MKSFKSWLPLGQWSDLRCARIGCREIKLSRKSSNELRRGISRGVERCRKKEERSGSKCCLKWVRKM